MCIVVGQCALFGAFPALAAAHGGATKDFRTEILSVTPPDVPVDVRVTSGDELRFENVGDGTLELCGYETSGCVPWVRIGPKGVYVDHNSEAYYINSAGNEQGEVPDSAGKGAPKFTRVRRAPAFYTYHDHRVHWMGGTTLPAGVDKGDPTKQKVFDGEVHFRYDGKDGVVTARLYYVGGKTWIQKYGEYVLVAAGVLFMLGFFVVDARRRRRRAGDEPAVEAAE
jgi:hypothetical protein